MREHVEFVQAQTLPWEAAPWARLSGTLVKFLSRDESSGACSVLLSFPAGWSASACGALPVAEEALILEGSLCYGSRQCRQDAYLWFPSGAARETLVAGAQGAVLLAFFDGDPDQPALGRAADALPPRIVDTFELGWESSGMDPAYADVGLRWKFLRGAAGAPDTTMLVACPPQFHPPGWKGPQEVHDCVEEMFLIGGDYLSNVGIMREGAYFWRPPGIAHGPYGTRLGNFALIRTLGHPLENNWTAHEVAIDRDGGGEAVIPPALRRIGARSDFQPQRF